MFSFFAPLTPAESPENADIYTTKDYQFIASEIELPPEPTWTCELYGMGKEQVWYTSKAPNWFWRLMQRLILGNHWKKP